MKSGKRSQDLHFGLGRLEASDEVRVDLHWRGTDGQLRSYSLQLKSGWHTVLLREASEKKMGGEP
jgi:hypothetical protein